MSEVNEQQAQVTEQQPVSFSRSNAKAAAIAAVEQEISQNVQPVQENQEARQEKQEVAQAPVETRVESKTDGVEISENKVASLIAKFQRKEKEFRAEKEVLKKEREYYQSQLKQLEQYKAKLEEIEKNPVDYLHNRQDLSNIYDGLTRKVLKEPEPVTSDIIESKIQKALEQERQARARIEAELQQSKQERAVADYRGQLSTAAAKPELDEIREFCSVLGTDLINEAYELANLHALKYNEILSPQDAIAQCVHGYQRTIESVKLVQERKSKSASASQPELNAVSDRPKLVTKTITNDLSPAKGAVPQKPLTLEERKQAVRNASIEELLREVTGVQ